MSEIEVKSTVETDVDGNMWLVLATKDVSARMRWPRYDEKLDGAARQFRMESLGRQLHKKLVRKMNEFAAKKAMGRDDAKDRNGAGQGSERVSDLADASGA